jgi:hypothetical protein
MRYRKRRGSASLNEDQVHELLTGEPAISVPPYYEGYGQTGFDLVAMQTDWEKHRESLLAFWISGDFGWGGILDIWDPTQGYPGTRPWAWWQFDAPEDDSDEARAAREVRAYAKDGKHYHPYGDARIERDLTPEREYLAARDLLLPGERKAMEAEQ